MKKLTLENYSNGDKTIDTLIINYVPVSIYDEYNSYIEKVNDFTKLTQEYYDKKEELAYIFDSILKQKAGIKALKKTEQDRQKYLIQKLASKELIKADRAEIPNISQEIKDLESKIKGYSHLYNDRIDLIMRVLKLNGIKDEKFYSIDFWRDCVNFNDDILLLNQMIADDSQKVTTDKSILFNEEALKSLLKARSNISEEEYKAMTFDQITEAIKSLSLTEEEVKRIWSEKKEDIVNLLEKFKKARGK